MPNRSLSRRILLVAVFSLMAMLGLFSLACGGQEPAIAGPVETSTRTPAPSLDVSSETPTPLATATPDAVVADRVDCAAIRGTDYRSPTEREWFLTNCLPTPTATSNVPVTETPVPSSVAAPNPPAIPGPEVEGERWVLVDLATQTTSAMIGDQVLYTALSTTGQDGWETPKGNWKIEYRVANETMTSASIGAEEYYVLEDVLYTQYFTTVGHALHLNYWRSDDYFGNIRSSHGCVGLRLADAEFFWNFATVGTRVTVQ